MKRVRIIIDKAIYLSSIKVINNFFFKTTLGKFKLSTFENMVVSSLQECIYNNVWPCGVSVIWSNYIFLN